MTRTEKYVNGLSNLIRCETISSDDNPDRTKFYAFHEVLKKEFPQFFAAVRVEEYDGSLLMIWRGKDASKDPVCFMNHHDVVEAGGPWTHDPFAPVVEDGKLYGRGTLDTKGGLYCMLQAAEELIGEGFVPERDIYFESACTEEINGQGCDTISKVLKKRGIHFYFTLDEGGMIVDSPIPIVSGKWAMIGVGEKGTADLKFIAKSNGGHASTPGKNSPLVRLGKFMYDVERSGIFTAEMNPVIQEMLERFSENTEGPIRLMLKNVGKYKAPVTQLLTKMSPTTNALVRTTLAFTMASGSDGRNVLPQEAWVIGNMRFSHHQGRNASLNAVRRFAKKYDIEMEVLDPGMESPISDFTSEGFRLVEKAVAVYFPEVKCSPYIMTGASDSRFMGRVAEDCLRFTPFSVNFDQVGTIHGIDENVDISALAPAVDFYKYLMKGV